MSTVNRLRCLEKLGEGTYGMVFKAKELSTGQVVAFKRMMINGEDEGVPATAIREVCLLKELKHDNIVALYDVLFEPPKMTLIFEYCEYDLKKYMDQNRNRSKIALLSEVRQIMKQILLGLRYMHRRHVVHRDLKPENIFLNVNHGTKGTSNGTARDSVGTHRPETGKNPSLSPQRQGEANNAAAGNTTTTTTTNNNNNNNNDNNNNDNNSNNSNNSDGSDALQLIVKLGDYGLARVENIPVKKYSHDVVSLWYRSPDVMMGSALYGFPVDMWSVGCIFAEVVTGKPLLNGRTDVEQIVRIFRLLGTPTQATWPSLMSYPKYPQLIESASKLVREEIAAMPRDAKHGAQQQQQPQQPNQVQTWKRHKERQYEITRRDSEANGARHSARPANDCNGKTNGGLQGPHQKVYNFPPELCFQPTFDDYVEKSRFRELAGDEAVDLLRGLLRYEPSHRVTAQEALSHPFMKNVKAPAQRQVDAMSAILRETLEERGLLELCNM